MKIISFFNIKGGVGKTALTMLMAYRLSEKGKKVLCIDADLQANLTQVMYKVNHNDPTLLHGLKEGYSADRLIIKAPNEEYPGVDIIPGDLSTCLLTEFLALQTGRERYVARWLYKNVDVLEQYDYIFVDLSPSIELHNRCWLYCLNSMVMVMKHGDIHSLRGIELLQQIYKKDMDALDLEDTCNKKVLINSYKNTNEEMIKYFNEVVKDYPFVSGNLLKNTISHKALISKSTSFKSFGLKLLKKGKSNKEVLEQLDKVIEELYEKEVY